MFYKPILVPLLAQVLLTFLVWIYMYLPRFREINRKHIDPQDLADRTSAQALLTSSAGPAFTSKTCLYSRSFAGTASVWACYAVSRR